MLLKAFILVKIKYGFKDSMQLFMNKKPVPFLKHF